MRLPHMLKEALKTERLVIKSPEIDDKVELTQLINDYKVCLLYTSDAADE